MIRFIERVAGASKGPVCLTPLHRISLSRLFFALMTRAVSFTLKLHRQVFALLASGVTEPSHHLALFHASLSFSISSDDDGRAICRRLGHLADR